MQNYKAQKVAYEKYTGQIQAFKRLYLRPSHLQETNKILLENNTLYNKISYYFHKLWLNFGSGGRFRASWDFELQKNNNHDQIVWFNVRYLHVSCRKS